MTELATRQAPMMDQLGLVLPDDMSLEEWASFAPRIKDALTSAAFAIGDWLVFGQERWAKQPSIPGLEGDPTRTSVPAEGYEMALAATGLDHTTLLTYAHVSKKVPREMRQERLSWEHHKIVAKLTGEDQRRWLRVSVGEIERQGKPISTRRLRASIQCGRLLTVAEMKMMGSDSDRGQENHIPAVNRLRAWWTNNREHVLAASREQREAIRRDLAPVVEIYEALS